MKEAIAPPTDWFQRFSARYELWQRQARDVYVAIAPLAEDKRVVLIAPEWRHRAGAIDAAAADAIVAALRFACSEADGIVTFWCSGGVTIDGGTAALDGAARMFAAIVEASRIVPHVAVVVGAAAGAAAYGAALADVRVQVRSACAFVTGPKVVRVATGASDSPDSIGGAAVHEATSGFAHVTAADDVEAVAVARDLIDVLGAEPRRFADTHATEDLDCNPALPDSGRRAYDVHGIIREVLDPGGIELHRRWAPNLVTVLGWIGGFPVGCIANNPARLAGCLDATSADKAAAFIKMCDRLSLPLLVLVDTPGYLPGADQEQKGVLVKGAAMLRAFSEARVPRITVILRKAFGGGYISMNSSGLGASLTLAWPDSEVGVMGGESAVAILHEREVASASPDERSNVAARLAAGYQAKLGPSTALDSGSIDAIIVPSDTRRTIHEALRRLHCGGKAAWLQATTYDHDLTRDIRRLAGAQM